MRGGTRVREKYRVSTGQGRDAPLAREDFFLVIATRTRYAAAVSRARGNPRAARHTRPLVPVPVWVFLRAAGASARLGHRDSAVREAPLSRPDCCCCLTTPESASPRRSDATTARDVASYLHFSNEVASYLPRNGYTRSRIASGERRMKCDGTRGSSNRGETGRLSRRLRALTDSSHVFVLLIYSP